MSYLLQSGDAFHPAPSRESLLDRLPVGNYTIEEGPSGLFFYRAEAFQPLGALYGDHGKLAERIVHSWSERSGNTGALLAGTKGSGKSYLGRLIAQKAGEAGFPTILITKTWSGEQLRTILSTLREPAVIFLDEFEKLYSDKRLQETFLSLLDGLSSTQHLFILTVNDVHQVDKHMRNRPGRLYYFLEFHGLDENFIREFCEDKLENKDHLEGVIELSNLFDEFNFDMLKSLVEEMNRFKENAREAAKYLNLSPQESLETYYEVTVTDADGEEIDVEGRSSGNPFTTRKWTFRVYNRETGRYGETLVFPQSSLSSYDTRKGNYIFMADGYTLELRGNNERDRPVHWTTFGLDEKF